MSKLRTFTPKALSVMMAGALLSACQSTPTNPTASTSSTPNTPPNTALITRSLAPSASAQEALVHAINAHLNSERYAVSSHHYSTAPLNVGETDKGADSAWTTFMKVMDFKDKARDDNSTVQPPFATLSTYLGEHGELGELPYLRYDDEQNGRTPDTVTRAVGMSDDYQAVSQEITSLIYQLDASYYNTYLSNFMDDKGNFDEKSFKKTLNDNDKQLNKEINTLLKKAQGYQKSDLRHLQSCVADFKTAKLTIAKQLKKGADNTDVIDADYHLPHRFINDCTAMVYYQTMLEPYYYIMLDQSTEQSLKKTVVASQCFAEQLHANKANLESGKKLTSIEEYTDNNIAYQSCIDQKTQILIDNGEITADYSDDEYDDYDPYSGPFGFLKAYRDMKAEETNGSTDKGDGLRANALDSSPFGPYSRMGGMFAAILGFSQTPEQITAQNLYQYQHLNINALSHHHPSSKQSQTLWSIDYNSPTSTYSMQVPVRSDYARGELTADVSALLPIVALISPEHAPLPKDVPDGLMSFALPEKLRKEIPTDIIYDAIHEGMMASVRELNSESFTATDISLDPLAKEVGASRVIKVSLGTKEAGKAYAVIAKRVGHKLKSYVDAHPEHYPDTVLDDVGEDGKALTRKHEVKALIDGFASLNTSYRTDDVGGLMQAIEGIAPFTLNGTSYVYLDASGRILATQTITQFDDGLSNATTHSLKQVRYDKGLFDKHALAGKFKDTFSKTAQVDGVALFKDAKAQNALEQEARYARYDYDYGYEYSSCELGDVVCEAAKVAAEAAAEAAVAE